MRYADIALLLLPVGLLVAWLAGIRGLSLRGTLTIFAVLAALGFALIWLGQDRGFSGHYEPAQLKAGHIQPGHAS